MRTSSDGAADLVDAEIDDLNVSDVKDRSDEQSGDHPDDDQDGDGSSLTRVQLLTASGRRLHREVVIDAECRQREYATRDCQACISNTQYAGG